jgi:hypothetical protein
MTKQSSKVRSSPEKARRGSGLWTYVMRGAAGVLLLGTIFALSQPGALSRMQEEFEARVLSRGSAATHGGVTKSDAQLASLFTPEVMYWQDDIRRWATDYNLNPNIIATIIQIESCGDPYVSSGAGAQGLFQVMPLHFDDRENQLSTDTNAIRGLNHLSECLTLSGYDVGVSFACYNGGASVINRPQSEWFQESRDYFRWGTGIYEDASNGRRESDTLNQWLAAGGSNLCQRASETQTLFLP